jgi:hypothetical protein
LIRNQPKKLRKQRVTSKGDLRYNMRQQFPSLAFFMANSLQYVALSPVAELVERAVPMMTLTLFSLPDDEITIPMSQAKKESTTQPKNMII